MYGRHARKSGELGAKELAAIMIGAFDRRARLEGEIRVRDVLTVDVVEGRIQAVRIVRNPDKLAHL